MLKIVSQIVNKIAEYQNIALFHHRNIDGDSLSSSYGLLLAIKKKWPNKNVVWIVDEAEMKANFSFFEYQKKYVSQKIDKTYLAIIGDTSSISQISNYETLIEAKEIICFDHHQNKINIRHDLFWPEPNYPASALQALAIAKALKIKFDEEIAFALMIGLVTDTGNFVYSLNDHRPPAAFAFLLQYISRDRMDWWWRNLYRKNLKEIELAKAIYQNLQFSGKVAYVYFDWEKAKSFNELNFKVKINLISNIENYPIWCLIVEEEDMVKIHLRSNGPNVAKVAMKHSGGGHKRAAGIRIPNQPDKIKQILKELNTLIENES